jgi:arsenate reductase
MTSEEKLKILFLCTGNSCRSQMAEGWTRHLKSDVLEPYSAGILPKGLDPLAVESMSEVGVDISVQRSKDVAELKDVSVDWVITVCDNAHEQCPLFPGKTRVVHVGFEDPPRLSRDAETLEAKMSHYRRVRDEIREFVASLPDALNSLF